MESLPTDIIRKTALELSPRDIISLCLTKKEFAKVVCNSNEFWRNKILTDYPKQTHFPFLFQHEPKKLYMILTMNSKIVKIDGKEFPKLVELYDDIDNYGEITKVIDKDFINENLLKRGDVLYLNWVGSYRNDGKFLWDGKKVVNLDYEDDDYGSVPKEFAFPEFRPDYFSESIVHNNIVRLIPEKINEVINNFDVDTQTSFVTDKYDKYEVVLDLPNLQKINIKFSRIFIDKDYLEYDAATGNFRLDPGFGGWGHSAQDYFKYIVGISPEWKANIISIEPKSPKTTYEWEEDNLKIITYR
jgi:hypothetical protein